jgi:hypothetical protein
MTTLEFIAKNLRKAKKDLERAKERPNVKQIDLDMLKEKVDRYDEILSALKELKITRSYIADREMTFDLLSYAKRKGFWE